jgi:hypothetical protein
MQPNEIFIENCPYLGVNFHTKLIAGSAAHGSRSATSVSGTTSNLCGSIKMSLSDFEIPARRGR